MPVLKYLDTASGTYKTLAALMLAQAGDDVQIAPIAPTPVNNQPELWIDTSDSGISSLPVSGVMGQNLNGNAPLDLFGVINEDIGNYGLPIYLDKNGLLRGQPMVVSGPLVNMLVTDPITRYPLGASVMGLSVAQATAGGWPQNLSSIVLTMNRDMGVGSQIWMRNTSTAGFYSILYRVWNNSAPWGAWMQIGGLYSDLAICTANVQLSTTAETDLTGMTLTVPSFGPSSVFMVSCAYDTTMLVATATAFLGKLNVGGTTQSSQAVWVPGTTASVNCRQMLNQNWQITGLAAGNQTFKAVASCSAINQYRVSGSHSTISVQQVA